MWRVSQKKKKKNPHVFKNFQNIQALSKSVLEVSTYIHNSCASCEAVVTATVVMSGRGLPNDCCCCCCD